ncbi:hypothetical protein MLD38_032919 [Melastoma candidum]|nr:hypothetical protein MLD38_032919 [Melastoma candidum]
MVLRAPGLSAAEGAGLPVAALTAYKCLVDTAGLKLDGSGEKKNVLITAASGGVGHYAVQIAKLANTHVTATCGSRNLDLVRSLGADEILDYKTPEGAMLKSSSGKKYDVVLNCTSGIPWSTFEGNLSKNGLVIDISPGPSTMLRYAWKTATFSRKKLLPLILSPTKELMESVMELVAAGKVKTLIDSRHPLGRAEDAWAKSLGGHVTGKVIVEFEP